MANRAFKSEYRNSFEGRVCDIYVNVLGTAGSDLTVYKWNGTALASAGTSGYNGLKSVTRNGTGDYTFKFTDTYTRLLDVSLNALSLDGSTTPAAVAYWIKAISPQASGGATVRVLFYLATPGTGVDPAANDLWAGTFVWSNSAAR